MSSLMPTDDKALHDVGRRGIGGEVMTPGSWQAMAPSDGGSGDGEVKEVKSSPRGAVFSAAAWAVKQRR